MVAFWGVTIVLSKVGLSHFWNQYITLVMYINLQHFDIEKMLFLLSFLDNNYFCRNVTYLLKG